MHAITALSTGAYSIFSEARFWLMVAVSVVLPLGIYAVLLRKRAISRTTVLLLGFAQERPEG